MNDSSAPSTRYDFGSVSVGQLARSVALFGGGAAYVAYVAATVRPPFERAAAASFSLFLVISAVGCVLGWRFIKRHVDEPNEFWVGLTARRTVQARRVMRMFGLAGLVLEVVGLALAGDLGLYLAGAATIPILLGLVSLVGPSR